MVCGLDLVHSKAPGLCRLEGSSQSTVYLQAHGAAVVAVQFVLHRMLGSSCSSRNWNRGLLLMLCSRQVRDMLAPLFQSLFFTWGRQDHVAVAVAPPCVLKPIYTMHQLGQGHTSASIPVPAAAAAAWCMMQHGLRGHCGSFTMHFWTPLTSCWVPELGRSYPATAGTGTGVPSCPWPDRG